MHHLLLQSQSEIKNKKRSKHTVSRVFQTFPSARKTSNLERRKFKIGFPKVEKMNSHHYQVPMFGLFKAKTVGGGHLFGLWLEDYFFQKNCRQRTDEVKLYASQGFSTNHQGQVSAALICVTREERDNDTNGSVQIQHSIHVMAKESWFTKP